jgi:hypothetical protein
MVPRYQWLGFQPSQYWQLIPLGVFRAQRFVTRSLQKALVGLASALMVVEVAPVQPAEDQEAFVTGGAQDPSLCENIQDTLRYSKH